MIKEFPDIKPDFSPPEGYFDQFEEDLMRHIHMRKSPKQRHFLRRTLSYASAACIAGFLIAGGLKLNRITKSAGMRATLELASEPLFNHELNTHILNDEDLLEWLKEPHSPVNNTLPATGNKIEKLTTTETLLNTDDLVEAGLIDPEDPELAMEGLF